MTGYTTKNKVETVLKHKITKILVALSLSVVLGGGLAACENETSAPTKNAQGKKFKLKPGTYKLAYFDQNTNYNSDSNQKAAFGLVIDGKTKELTVNLRRVKEHVGLKYADSPYVVVKESDLGEMRLNIYRGPYQQYIQTDVSGTVTDK